MNWQRALAECAHVMRELHEVREAGFTAEALHYPRPPLALRLLCAFNGAPAGWAPPRGWHYFPDYHAAVAWQFVEDKIDKGGSPLDLARAYAPGFAGFTDEPTRKAWERVHVAAQQWTEREAA